MDEIGRKTLLKTLAAIRLLLAAALMVLFSGTMAFAHSGHDHSKASYSAVSNTSTIIVSAKDLAPAAKISVAGALDKAALVIEARSDQPQTSIPCGAGCCCCGGGPSNCGMAGGCAVHALSPALSMFAPNVSADGLKLPALAMLTGRDVAGLDRPPNPNL